ncbi:arylesterase [Maricurvus nonylphenolicus]|uniref:arylesterase n=1 Tax=Maricurvus nonylphenolicus TaxID=1008307 RepID=UPI0036F26C8D
MKTKPFITGVILSLLVSISARAETIMVLGDSLSAGYGIDPSQGWVNLLQQQLGDDHKVINASVSGETSGGGLHRLPPLLREHTPDWIILELGGNDGLRGYPLTTVRRNLEQIIDTSTKSGGRVLLIGMHIPPNYGPRYSQQFSSLYVELAENYDLPIIANFIDTVATSPELMQADGIHPTAEAQPLLMEQVFTTLKPQLKNTSP